MSTLLATPMPASVLVAATTAHLALLLLRRHRNPPGARHDVLLL